MAREFSTGRPIRGSHAFYWWSISASRFLFSYRSASPWSLDSALSQCREGSAEGKVTLPCASHCARNRLGQEQNRESALTCGSTPTWRRDPGGRIQGRAGLTNLTTWNERVALWGWMFLPKRKSCECRSSSTRHLRPSTGWSKSTEVLVVEPGGGTRGEECRALDRCPQQDKWGSQWQTPDQKVTPSDQHPRGGAVQSSHGRRRHSWALCHLMVPFPPTGSCGALEITVLKWRRLFLSRTIQPSVFETEFSECSFHGVKPKPKKRTHHAMPTWNAEPLRWRERRPFISSAYTACIF